LLQNAAAGLMVLANRRAGMFSREDISELTLAYLRECLSVARAEGRSWTTRSRRRFWRVLNARQPI
jgi:2-dehydropantoate 2-reductase